MFNSVLDLDFRLGIQKGKVKSVQEHCAKCFVVYILKFKILQTTRKNKTKTKHQNAKSIGEKLKTKDLMFFVSFFFM